MTKKIIAIILAIACVATVFALAACGKKDDEVTTTAAPTEAEDFFNDVTNAPTTEAPTQTVTKAVAKSEVEEIVASALGENFDIAAQVPSDAQKAALETAAAAKGYSVVVAADGKVSIVKTEVITTVPGETTTLTPAPQTKEEIVAYFNKAVNGVKTDAKSVKRHSSEITLNGSTKLPGWADTVLKVLGGADKFIGDQLAKNSKGEEVFTGDAIKASFPVEGESYASKLTAADVKSATLTESNGQYTIKVTTIADERSGSVKHGEGHAPKAFNVVLPGIVNENVPGVAKKMIGGPAEMNYPSSTATIIVDAATGHIIKAVYDLKWTINFGTDVTIPFTTLDKYSFVY